MRFGRHDTYDRLAFDFCKPADTTLKATVVNQLTEDGSGNKVTLKGKHFFCHHPHPSRRTLERWPTYSLQ